MFYLSCVPSPPLSEFVDRFWTCSDKPSHMRERILPSGTISLVVNLVDDEIRIFDPSRSGRCTRYSGAVISGTYSRGFVIDPRHAAIVGVHFKPGGSTFSNTSVFLDRRMAGDREIDVASKVVQARACSGDGHLPRAIKAISNYWLVSLVLPAQVNDQPL